MGSVVALKKHQGFQKKVIKFGGKTVELFSMDGATWSSRPAELPEIKARHEAQSVPFGSPLNKAGAGKGKPMRKMAPVRGRLLNRQKADAPKPMLTADQAKELFQNAKDAATKRSLKNSGAAPKAVEKKGKAKAETEKVKAGKKKAARPAPKKRASSTPKKKSKAGKSSKRRAA